MWSILTPFLIGRATGGWRYMRVALLAILIGCAVVGLIYAAIIFNAVRKTPEKPHVQHYSAQ
jgi:hypothetical protein